MLTSLASRAEGRVEQDSRTWCSALTMWDSPSPAWSTGRLNQPVSGVGESQNGVANIPFVLGRSSMKQAGRVSIESVNLAAALHTKASPSVNFAAKPAPRGAEPCRRQERRPYHALVNVQAACLQELCQARHQVPFLDGTEVTQRVEVQILRQVARHCVKGVQEAARTEKPELRAKGLH